MSMFKKALSVSNLTSLLWDEHVSRNNMIALTNSVAMTNPNEVEKAIHEELMCGHITTKDIHTAIKESDVLLDEYLTWCESQKWDAKTFIKNLVTLCGQFDIEDFKYDAEIGISTFNPDFWNLVGEVKVAPQGIQITIEEFDGWTTKTIGVGPFTALEKNPDESWILVIAKHINTL